MKPTPEEAKEHGCIFYVLPDALKQEYVDPLLWKAVQRINQSGWVWTAESCQGHPDADDSTPTCWEHNTNPFMRFVTTEDRMGTLLALLLKAAVYPNDLGFNKQLGMIIWPGPYARPPYAEVLVYFQAHNVALRNEGCRAFERLAEMVVKEEAPS